MPAKLAPLPFCIDANACLQHGFCPTSRQYFAMGDEPFGYERRVVAADQYVKKWLKRGDNFSLALELMRAPLPKDSDDFAADYGNPTFAFGVRYTFNNKVSLHREADTDWGMLIPVGYHSPLGNTLSLYTTFYRSASPFANMGKRPTRSVVAWVSRPPFIIRITPSTTSLSVRTPPFILLLACTNPFILLPNGPCGLR